jgi:hypothetical protein
MRCGREVVELFMTFEEMPKELQQVIAEANARINRTSFPTVSKKLIVPVMKPIKWAYEVTPETEKRPVCFYKAHFALAKELTPERGRYVFEYLEE